MKNIEFLLLSLLLLFSVVGRGSNQAAQPEESTVEETEMQPSIAEIITQSVTDGSSVAETEGSTSESNTEIENKVLIAYFSRWGNTEYPDDVDATTSASIVADGEKYGTTEYVARMIQKNVGGDLYLIQTEMPYPSDYD